MADRRAEVDEGEGARARVEYPHAVRTVGRKHDQAAHRRRTDKLVIMADRRADVDEGEVSRARVVYPYAVRPAWRKHDEATYRHRARKLVDSAADRCADVDGCKIVREPPGGWGRQTGRKRRRRRWGRWRGYRWGGRRGCKGWPRGCRGCRYRRGWCRGAHVKVQVVIGAITSGHVVARLEAAILRLVVRSTTSVSHSVLKAPASCPVIVAQNLTFADGLAMVKWDDVVASHAGWRVSHVEVELEHGR